MNKKSILITKLISDDQKEKLTNFDLFEQELIRIELKNDIPSTGIADHVVFSSRNAVKALKKNGLLETLQTAKIYCVGEKTAEILGQFNFKVEFIAESAFDLANFLVLAKPNHVTFFCGNLRREELIVLLTENGICFDEHIVYRTTLLNPTFSQKFDGILFFSPSGVRSFCKKNKPDGVAYCLGNTTAISATDYFEEVFVAEEQSIEGLIRTLNENYGYA